MKNKDEGRRLARSIIQQKAKLDNTVIELVEHLTEEQFEWELVNRFGVQQHLEPRVEQAIDHLAGLGFYHSDPSDAQIDDDLDQLVSSRAI